MACLLITSRRSHCFQTNILWRLCGKWLQRNAREFLYRKQVVRRKKKELRSMCRAQNCYGIHVLARLIRNPFHHLIYKHWVLVQSTTKSLISCFFTQDTIYIKCKRSFKKTVAHLYNIIWEVTFLGVTLTLTLILVDYYDTFNKIKKYIQILFFTF